MIRIVVVLMAVAVCMHAEAQRKGDRMQMVKPPKGAVCYASTKNEFTTIGPPLEYIRNKARQGTARTKTANIEVTYEGFTPEAQGAFQEAVDIWESILQTSVTIHIRARWTALGQGILGSAGPGTYVTNFEGAPKEDVWYPVAVAEKIAGKELNDSGEPDIDAAFNSANESWHFGLTGDNPPAGSYDLVSIVLHEIGHGLGITHGYSVSGGLGVIPDYFSGRPVVYETNLQIGGGKNFVNDFTPPSVDLKNAMTGASLFFASPLVRSVNSNFNAVIYAPSSYSAGSSVAHVDENTYPAGNVNSLMTPFIGAAERILDPGPISRNILREIGWEVTVLKHTPIKNTESTTGPYHAVVKIVNDNGYDANSVTMNYKTTGSFTTVPMVATANADEFAADLPVGSSKYNYFISVKDNDLRMFTAPGTIITPGSAPQQANFVFEAGPDTKQPVINHTPKEFITATENLDLQAIVSDNIGIDNVKVDWKLNGDPQPAEFMVLKPNTDSTYALVINFSTDLHVGDLIEYRIRAEDSSIAGNVSFKPSPTTYYEVNVTGLGETKDSYSNDFNAVSAVDFFGNGFTVSKPAGFNDGAIHSDHPYAAGGAADAHVDLIYNLKTPIRIAAKESVLKFDEIVLVEPGEDGVAWPDANFFDYVVVEGSADGGVTWVPIADGYDSRENSVWADLWNSTVSNQNSTATGNPTLYRPHSFNLLDKFQPGDEVAFRFRLFSDPFSFGWGWSIDNLKIQIDDTPPSIRHQHLDFLLEGTASVKLDMMITDANPLNQIFVDYNVNGGSVTTTEVIVNPATNLYSQTIDLSGIGVGDELQYRIRATDPNGNIGSFPSTGFIRTTIVSLTSSVDAVATDFASPNADLIGNFFNVSQAPGFTSPAINSNHPYDVGLGIDGISDFTWMTKKPVKVSANNPLIYYEDAALVEYGSSGIKDYVVVEASKNGTTWEQLILPYSANAVAQWRLVYDQGGSGGQSLLQPHTLSITAGGKFKAGDLVLIRFRLHSDSLKSGWGWVVDNLSIQGAVTGLESTATDANVEAWPNPVAGGSLYLKMALPGASDVSVEILTTQGQLLSNDRFSAPSGDFQREYDVNNWPDGFYIVKVRSDFGTSVRKLIKVR